MLTDKDYKIVTLLRSYKLADETNVTVGVKYPTEIKQNIVRHSDILISCQIVGL